MRTEKHGQYRFVGDEFNELLTGRFFYKGPLIVRREFRPRKELDDDKKAEIRKVYDEIAKLEKSLAGYYYPEGLWVGIFRFMDAVEHDL